MNTLYKSVTGFMCLMFTLQISAQQNTPSKPSLFAAYPSVINCTEQELSRVFTLAEGQPVVLSFSNNFNFGGSITSRVTRYSNLQSSVIKSPVFNNAIFSLSKRTNADNSITYVGGIINENYADGYMLKKDNAGAYSLQKIELSRQLPTCTQ
jgi:hypothetical protein